MGMHADPSLSVFVRKRGYRGRAKQDVTLKAHPILAHVRVIPGDPHSLKKLFGDADLSFPVKPLIAGMG